MSLQSAQAKTRTLRTLLTDLRAHENALQHDLAEAQRAEAKEEALAEHDRLTRRLFRAECAYLRHSQSGNTKLRANAARKMYALMDKLGMEY